MTQDTTYSISKSVTRFFSGTMISRCTGLVREVAMAAAFGTHPVVAAFWMAFRFASLLRRLFGEGALNAAFVPHFESVRKQDSALGARFFYDLSMGVALLLLFLTVALEAIFGAVLLFGSVQEANREVIQLTMLMLPAVVFISLYALNTSLLNCERTYFTPSVAPAVVNLIWIAMLIAVWHKPINQAVEYLAMVIALAFMFQWLVTVPDVWRYLSRELGKNWRQQRFSGLEIVKIIRPFALGIAGVAATQVNTALDAIFARAADPEGPAFLWYAIRIQQLPLALFGVGLTGALLPPIARAIQKQQTSDYLNFMNYAIKRAILLMLPITAAIFALGFSGINLVYGHGEFSAHATLQTTLCLWAYGIGLLPTTLVLIFASAFYAHKNYRIPTIFALGSVFLNVSLNAVFVYVWQLGAVSIALATSLSACLNCILLGCYLKTHYGLNLNGIFLPACKVMLATVFALILTILFGYNFFHDNTLPWIMHQAFRMFPRELAAQLLHFGCLSFFFSLVFIVSTYLLRINYGFRLRS